MTIGRGATKGEGKPQMVRLKFAPGSTVRRLEESMWHPLEKLTDLPDGSCIWEAQIAGWQEMLPGYAGGMFTWKC